MIAAYGRAGIEDQLVTLAAAGIVTLSKGVMLLRSVARWLGAGKPLARL